MAKKTSDKTIGRLSLYRFLLENLRQEGAKDVFSHQLAAAANCSAAQVRRDLMAICHGGPFDEPENVGLALKKMPGIVGFFGASSIERLPTERAIRSQVESFKGLALTGKQ